METYIDVDGNLMSSRYAHQLGAGKLREGWGDTSRTWAHIHEAGHTVAALAEGYRIINVELAGLERPYAGITTIEIFGKPLPTSAYFAAGERAVDRWLRETQQWTPESAVINEASACGDRGYYHWRDAHDLADAALDRHWTAVLAVADALKQRGRLDGGTVAGIVGDMGIRVEVA